MIVMTQAIRPLSAPVHVRINGAGIALVFNERSGMRTYSVPLSTQALAAFETDDWAILNNLGVLVPSGK